MHTRCVTVECVCVCVSVIVCAQSRVFLSNACFALPNYHLPNGECNKAGLWHTVSEVSHTFDACLTDSQ